MADLNPAPRGYPIKLVRDNTPDIVNPSEEPGSLWYSTMFVGVPEELTRLLKLKLSEEVGEFLVDGGVDELRDVQAVIDGLVANLGLDREEFRTAVDTDPRGGFLKAVVMLGHHDEFDGEA